MMDTRDDVGGMVPGIGEMAAVLGIGLFIAGFGVWWVYRGR